MPRSQTFAMILIAVLSTVAILRLAFGVRTEILVGMLAVGVVTTLIETRADP